MSQPESRRLSAAYGRRYEDLLAAVGATPGVEPTELATFWPMVGRAYTGDLMVIGRAVNGWIDRVKVADLAHRGACIAASAAARATGEPADHCPLRWVTDAWGGRPSGEYSTARSAFWRFIRGVLAAVAPESRDDPRWSSRIVWSNLAKLAPWTGGNPGGALLDLQRSVGPRLLGAEIEELAPRRVLVLTGRWWFEPFAQALALDVAWRSGPVEGVADGPDRRWVVGPHPQGKPRGLLDEVIAAFRHD